VDGHQDLPGDGHEVEAMAVTDGDRICWSSRRESAQNTDYLESFSGVSSL
jgi:hypothetical protein